MSFNVDLKFATLCLKVYLVHPHRYNEDFLADSAIQQAVDTRLCFLPHGLGTRLDGCLL